MVKQVAHKINTNDQKQPKPKEKTIYVTSFLSIPCLSNSETLFNSCERLLWGTLISGHKEQ